MITFAFPTGLLLLLLVPPLILLARRRAIPKRVVLTAFFLLEEVLRLRHRQVPRIFRLSRNQRMALLLLMVLSLALAAAGVSWERRVGIPRRLLLVVDNIPTALREFGGGETVAASIRRRVASDASSATAGDTITLLTTSPSPRLSTFFGGRGLADASAAVTPSHLFPTAEAAAAEVVSIARFYDRAVVLTPRAGAWREALRNRPSPRPVIPGDREAVQGNAGIISLRIRPNRAEEGVWDLLASVAAVGRPLPGIVRIEQGALLVASATPSRSGGELYLERLRLRPGELAVAIAPGDPFPLDDRVTLQIPGDDPVRASVTGMGSDLIAAAVKAATGASPAAPGKGEVDLFLGDPPGKLQHPSLVIAPSAELPGLQFRELSGIVSDIRWHPLHPITAGLAGQALRPDRALSFRPVGPFTSVATADGLPVVLAGSVDGHRTVVWTFSPLDGGLFLKPEFVILLSETLRWLGRPGESEPSPPPSRMVTSEAASIAMPDLSAPLFPGEKTASQTTPLAPWFLAIFLLAGIFLAVADSFTAGEAQER